jgi:hypothetical protein
MAIIWARRTNDKNTNSTYFLREVRKHNSFLQCSVINKKSSLFSRPPTFVNKENTKYIYIFPSFYTMHRQWKELFHISTLFRLIHISMNKTPHFKMVVSLKLKGEKNPISYGIVY